MPQQTIDTIQILVSAGSGALAGSLVSIVTGPTIAEREERGRRRVAARQEIGRRLQDFRYKLANSRLALLESQPPNADELVGSAFGLAKEVYASLPIIPRIERARLRKAIGGLLGHEMLEVARLRPREDRELTDVASISAAMLYRSAPGSHLNALLELDPSSAEWESAMRRGERLSRKYV
jgi:hypothetical protein